MHRRVYTCLFLSALLFGIDTRVCIASTAEEPDQELADTDTGQTASLRHDGWRVTLDNDILTGRTIDRDYTGGIGFTYSGTQARDNPVSLDKLREVLARGLHSRSPADGAGKERYYSQQVGLMLFTPDDISSTAPVYDDRPYASLLFMSNSAVDIGRVRDSMLISRLTIGILGLDLAADIQRALHAVTDSDVPNGWDHQVSAGGEPALMLELARRDALYASDTQQWMAGWDVVIGSLTEADASIGWRAGDLHSPWWSSVPSQARYIEQSMPVFGAPEGEWFVYAGAKLRLIAYNALLQGQFRYSEVTIADNDLERLVAEYWGGIAFYFAGHYTLDMYLRGNTAEFNGTNSRSANWAGIGLSYAW